MKLNKTVLALAISAVILSGCSEDEKDASLTDGSQTAASGINETVLFDAASRLRKGPSILLLVLVGMEITGERL